MFGLLENLGNKRQEPEKSLDFSKGRKILPTGRVVLATFILFAQTDGWAATQKSSDAATQHAKVGHVTSAHHPRVSKPAHPSSARHRKVSSRHPRAAKAPCVNLKQPGGAAHPSKSNAGKVLSVSPVKPSKTAEQKTAEKGSQTGLPLPRFASLRADKVYFRRGPGQRYPIEWVYHRRGLPVKIEREFDVWRLVEDSDGIKAWVHQATLVGQRTFVVPSQGPKEVPADSLAQTAASRHTDSQIVGYLSKDDISEQSRQALMLYRAPQKDAHAVAILRHGVVGKLLRCPAASDWCEVNVKGYKGWLERNSVWGVLPGETVAP